MAARSSLLDVLLRVFGSVGLIVVGAAVAANLHRAGGRVGGRAAQRYLGVGANEGLVGSYNCMLWL